MWPTAATAGRRRTGSMRRFFTGLRWRRGAAGARYHAIGDEGLAFREIAEVIGKRLNLPVVSKLPAEAVDHFGFLGLFAGMDAPTSAAQTRQQLGWRPTRPGLIADLEHAGSFAG